MLQGGGHHQTSISVHPLRRRVSIDDDCAQTVAAVQRLQGLLSARDTTEFVRDEMVQRNLTLERPVDEHGHSIPGLPATKCGSHAAAAGDELKRPGADLFPGSGDANDGAFSPT